MNFLLEIVKDDYSKVIINDKGLSETLLFGLQIVLIGMATIFSVLVLIWIALSLFKIFFHDLPKKKNAKPIKVVPVVEKPAFTPAASADEEIVAVIAAAIAMAEAEGGGAKFRVVSFRRK